jgi:hypothetical protein
MLPSGASMRTGPSTMIGPPGTIRTTRGDLAVTARPPE